MSSFVINKSSARRAEYSNLGPRNTMNVCPPNTLNRIK